MNDMGQAHRHHYPELERALETAEKQSELYRPTAFWASACLSIAEELRTRGVEQFRSLPSPLAFFVPTYGIPGNSFDDLMCQRLLGLMQRDYPDAIKARLALDEFLSGRLSALADYRTVMAADATDRLPSLHRFSESAVGKPAEQFDFDGRRFSRSSLNYLMGLALLKKHLGDDVPRSVLEIGGGFGTLGEILASSSIEDVKYIDVDIPPVGFIASFYLRSVLGADKVTTGDGLRDHKVIEIDALQQTSVLHAWQLEQLHGQIDLFVNFISFQEMEPPVVRNYIMHIKRLAPRWILLRNLREGKQVRKGPGDVGVDAPIRSDDYTAMLTGYKLVDRNVVPFGYQTVDGFNSELLLLASH